MSFDVIHLYDLLTYTIKAVIKFLETNLSTVHVLLLFLYFLFSSKTQIQKKHLLPRLFSASILRVVFEIT